MSEILHEAIIVTSWSAEKLKIARSIALSHNLPCSEFVRSPVNGYASFMIATDGSKEGWEAAAVARKNRDKWVAWVKRYNAGKGCQCLEWVHVEYGGVAPQGVIDQNIQKT